LKVLVWWKAERRINGQVTRETRYYLLSLPSNVQRFAQSVRCHWGIKNQLHWILDADDSE
jgi:predicted transposase YbfD/YdcC